MSKNPFGHGQELYDYLKSVSVRESPELALLRKATQGMDSATMQISPDQGQFMALLVKLLDARIIVEVGTYTGYSALAMAGALPGDGRLIACDISREWTNIGLPFWEQAGVRDKIDLRIAPALDTLDQLLEQGLAGKVDLVFIDADKTSYVNYYDRAYQLLRPNGLILIDNVFWGGAVADPDITDEDTIAIRQLNDLVSRDHRVDISMISVGDGLFLARKK